MTGASSSATRPSGSLASYSDPATRAQHLLDIISVANVASSALEDIAARSGDKLPKQCRKDLQLVIDGLQWVYKEGRRHTPKVSAVPYLLNAYHMRTTSDKTEKSETETIPRKFRGSTSLWKMHQFIDDCRPQKRTAPGRSEDETSQSPPTKTARRSERTVTPEKEVLPVPPDGDGRWNKRTFLAAVTGLIGTEKTKAFVNSVLAAGPAVLSGTTYKTPNQLYKLYNKDGFTGKPPDNAPKWTKESLVAAMSNLEAESVLSTRAFLQKVLEVGKSDYNTVGGMFKLYNNWKKRGTTEAKMGRPATAPLSRVDAAIREKFDRRTGNSSAFGLEDMKKVLAESNKATAESRGLDPDTVNVEVSDRTAKTYEIAAAMRKGKEDLPGALSNKKLQTKTESRYVAENDVQGALAYALTCLSTHYCEGPCPPHLAKRFKYEELNDGVKKSIEMMKEAMGVDEVHPIDTNLGISTDDTTVFAFEGCKQTGEWEWKLIDKANSSSVRSDFKVGDDAANKGGLRVRLTFSFTASGMYAPLYVAISGLTEEELSPEICPDGILPVKVDNLCKGGDGVNDCGFGWVVFLRADKNRKAEDLTIGNKKFMHYNEFVLLPFIRKIREKLGWKPGEPVPDWLKAVCWFDGDLPQLQTMLFESNEALDIAEKIVRNKHSAAATGTQQPADLSPVFKLLKWAADRMTAKDFTSCGLEGIVNGLFASDGDLRKRGLNLDGNPRKKKSLMDFLKCLPKLCDEVMTAKRISRGFVEAGMIDEETGMFPSFEKLMQTCKRWGSASKNVGLPKAEKDNVRDKVQPLLKIQFEKGQVTSAEMTPAGIPRALNSRGDEVEKDRPSGPDAEHLQYSKTVNAEPQRIMRAERRLENALKAHGDALAEYNIVRDILARNKEVEKELAEKTATGVFSDATIAIFLSLKSAQLKDFVWCRKFNGKTFRVSELAGLDGKLNKTLRKDQTAEQIESECSDDWPCLVWLAWKLRSCELVLQPREMPVLSASLLTPSFDMECAAPATQKSAKKYLSDESWLNAFKSVVKGVNSVEVTDEVMANANDLQQAMELRLAAYASTRVHSSKRNHWTLRFVRDNLAPMAAAMCLAGHVLPNINRCGMMERLLQLPVQNTFQQISVDLTGEKGVYNEDLAKLEGSYILYDTIRYSPIRSGMNAGDGADANFSGRCDKHLKNSQSLLEMRNSRLYRCYPFDASDGANLGGVRGEFRNLVMYCAMAFDKSSNVEPLCSDGNEDSLFVWSKESIDELKKKGGTRLRKVQLDSVAYLWELCYDLLLAKGDNISDSPGFEAFGLRVNRLIQLLDE